ncbi:MAG: hypothetical protein U0228_31480 [Myxococcaceae bacterium]
MRHIALTIAVLGIGGVVTGCAREPAKTLSAPVAKVTTACTRVEKAQIGQLPLTIEVGGRSVQLAEWTMADETATSVIGFAARLPESVEFTVNAGERTFHGNQARWLHPQAFTGGKGIDAVTFCTNAPLAPVVASR